MSTLPPNKPITPSVPSMITQDLGYCCAEMFFALYPNKHTVSLRLGVTPDTVKKWKSRIEKGECNCTDSPGCLKAKTGKATVRLAAKAIKLS